MNKLSLALVTLLVGLQSSPLLAHAQMVTVHENYTPFFLDGQSYKDSNGVLQANPRYDVTTKMKIKNDSVNVNMNTFHYVHFWDDANTYLGHYATTTADTCSTDCIGTLPSSISTSYAIPIPPTSYTFALERFDRADANYEIANGVTIEEFFEDQTNYYENNTIPIDELSSKTLAQMYPPTILNNLQLVTNGDFSNGTTGWVGQSATLSNPSNHILITGGLNLLSSARAISNTFQIITNNQKYYSIGRARVTNNVALNIGVDLVDSATSSLTSTIIIDSPIENSWYLISGIYNTLSTGNGNIQMRIRHSYADAATANGKVMEVDYAYTFNLSTLIANKTYSPMFNTTFDLMSDANIKTQMDTWVAQGLTNVSLYYYATALSYVPTLTVQQFIDYYDFYTYNRTSTFGFTPGLFTIKDDEYYANDTYEFVRNLTEIFGAGQEPLLTDLQQWETDYEQLDDYSYILPSAWHNQAITSNTYVWDDEISDTIDNSLLIIASGVIGFLTMLFGIANRNPLFHLISIGAFIVFTALFQHVAIIIIGIALMIINAMYIAGRRV